jgi:hypothetical protein
VTVTLFCNLFNLGQVGYPHLEISNILEQMPIGGYSTKSVGNITERLMNQHVKQLHVNNVFSFFRDKTVYFACTPNWMDDNRFVVILMDESITSHLVWAFQRDSEFTEFFNYNLNWLKENGVFYKEYTRREYKVNKGRELIACSLASFFPFRFSGLFIEVNAIGHFSIMSFE